MSLPKWASRGDEFWDWGQYRKALEIACEALNDIESIDGVSKTALREHAKEALRQINALGDVGK